MSGDHSRRFFLTGSLAGLGSLSFLSHLPAPAPLPRRRVQLSSDLEPLVELIESTPRSKIIETIIAKIKKGTSYQDLLGAVFLAGVRGVEPRPVGFKFHAVLVINSAHLASQAAKDQERWLPLLWSMDRFKISQEDNRRQGGWFMKPANDSQLPVATKAKQSFLDALNNWEIEPADRAIVALTRCAGANEIFEIFWRYGARDFRDIGHKIIYAANAWRTLQAIGWRHAEPVLRSLTYALLEHSGTNPAKRDDPADRPGRINLKRTVTLQKDLLTATRRSSQATQDVLASIRTASADDAAETVGKMLKKGTHPASLWDGLFLAAGELLMRQPGIVGLHSMTSINALHYAYQTCASAQTRVFLLLQTASFLSLFREAMRGRGKLADLKIDKLEKTSVKAKPDEVIADIFASVGKNRLDAARKAYTLLQSSPRQIKPLMATARSLIFAKGTDSHDYKFSSAALEDYHHLTPALRPHFAAASMYWLRGSKERDNSLIKDTRASLAKG